METGEESPPVVVDPTNDESNNDTDGDSNNNDNNAEASVAETPSETSSASETAAHSSSSDNDSSCEAEANDDESKPISESTTNDSSSNDADVDENDSSEKEDAAKTKPSESSNDDPPLPSPNDDQEQASTQTPSEPVEQQQQQQSTDEHVADSEPKAATDPADGSKKDKDAAADDDDIASKAAVALAAVAAAAVANNKSPAEAAKEARAVAQSFIKSSDDSGSGGKRTLQPVRIAAVRTHLQNVESPPALVETLGRGENDAFLRYLLMMEYYRSSDDDDNDDNNNNANASAETNPRGEASTAADQGGDEPEDEEIVEARAAEASEQVLLLLKKLELAYDSLVHMLPDVPESNHDDYAEEDEYESSVVIPDLLPPCNVPGGDKTVAFFKACMGEMGGNNEEKSDDRRSQAGSVDGPDFLEQPSTASPPPSPTSQQQQQQQQSSGSSVFNMFRRAAPAAGGKASTGAGPAAGILNSFRRRSGAANASTESSTAASTTSNSFDNNNSSDAITPTVAHRPGDYVVNIEREMLGLTVENVLERTVVRTVLATGPAKKAGAKVGSLIVQVGNVETKNLTHFETIDELRQSQRPLQLVLRQVGPDSLRLAREEMGRLIKGSGFGVIMDGNAGPEENAEAKEEHVSRPLIGADLRIDAYTNLLRRRFAEVSPQPRNKKEEALARVGEKMAWILTLFTIGLEREAMRRDTPQIGETSLVHHHHTPKEYGDAAKSTAKVLLDYSRKKLDRPKPQPKSRSESFIQHSLETAGGARRRKGPPPPPPAPRGKRNVMQLRKDDSVVHEKPLLQIGDVLQRTRTFLADTTSPPAALLRGELIGFLCDVLDIDTDLELCEDDAGGSLGAQGGPINDLGSAGSLLKLIILNCPIMRSPGCEYASAQEEDLDPEFAEELLRRFGEQERLSVFDRHKLHAGNRFLAVVHRLAASRSTSARITACSLGPVIWGHLDFPHQLQLRGVITRALHDVEVLVRKATATVLHEIAELVFDQRCVPWLVLMCERAMTDPEPQMRSAAMTLTWHLAEHLPNAFQGDASQGSAYLRRLPERNDPIFADVYLLQCKLLPVATRLAEDRSPSVRLAVAAQCDRLCFALGDHWSSVVIDALLALLSDADERVRCEAVMCVPRLADIVLLSHAPGETAASEVSILEALIPASIKLQKDGSPSVRVSLASAAGDLLTLLVGLQRRVAEIIPGENHENENLVKYKRQVDDRLIPLVQNLLNDKDPEVTSGALRAVTNASRKSVMPPSRIRQMSVASEDDSLSVTSYHSHTSREPRQPVFLPVLSEIQVMRLLPTLTALANSKQWRVRQSAVEIVPALLGCTQKLETRSEISKLCLRLMDDNVDAVRRTAAECLCMGGSSLGSHGEGASAEWTVSIVIPAIRRGAVHKISKQRILSLKMVEILLLNGACPSKWVNSNDTPQSDRMTDSPMRELAAIALSLTSDRIANVRLNVGRVLEEVLHEFEEAEISFIREILQQQVEEEKQRNRGGDQDVLFFSRRCIDRATNLLSDGSSLHDGKDNVSAAGLST